MPIQFFSIILAIENLPDSRNNGFYPLKQRFRMAQSRPNILELSHVYPASAERLFSLWTQEEELLKWSELDQCQLDVRPGGHYRLIFPAPPGKEDITVGQYVEVLPPRRLAFTWDGLSPAGPTGQTLVSIDLLDHGGGCELRLRHEFIDEPSMIECKSGWEYWLQSLATFLDGDSK
jgi:uncharacterized protein YndB with AHSA1/START domain